MRWPREHMISGDDFEAFQAEVNSYLVRTGSAKSSFGEHAAGDRNFIACRLHQGKSMHRDVVTKVRTFMAQHPDGLGTMTEKQFCYENEKLAISREEIEQRRGEGARRHRAHVAACRAAHRQKYGSDDGFGRSLELMPA